MRYVTSFLILFIGFTATAQMPPYLLQEEARPVEASIYSFVEQMPTPKFDVMEHIAKNFRYPADAKKKMMQGRVMVKFVVNEDGSLSHFRVVRAVYPSLDSEAVRVLKLMPPWQPGKQGGKPVRVYYLQPVSIRLE